MARVLLPLLLFLTIFFGGFALADDDDSTNNNRMKTEEGSKSPFSGQFNLTYYGSSLDHPFSKYAPNPGNTEVPPLVTLSGTVSARYRFDRQTTAGLGTGVTTQTPFQGPKNTTAANPYVDVAHSFVLFGWLHNRADYQITLWTEEQLHTEYGQQLGFTFLDESYTELGRLTVGLAFEVDLNSFSGDARYNNAAVHRSQVSWDVYPEPYFEFVLGKHLNLRSVVGIEWDHNRALAGTFDLYGPRVYQTLGLGISLGEAVFLYPYLKGYPYSGTFGVKTTTVGLNAIVNLF